MGRQGYYDRASLDMLIQSQTGPIENKEDKGLNSVKRGQVRKIRKQDANKWQAQSNEN